MWVYVISSVLSSIICLLFLQNRKKRQSFESKGLPYLGNGTIRLILNTARGQSFIDDLNTQYKVMKNKGITVAASNDFGQTTLMVTDTDLLKAIFVKDFDHFSDRRTFATGPNDVMFTKMLFAMTGERWKHLRSKLSPTFTTGKIKRVFRLFDQSGKKFVKFLESEIQNAISGDVELTEAYSKFTMDIIASAACGIDSQAFNQKEPSLFEKMGKGLQFQFGAKQILKVFGLVFLPKIVTSALGLSFFEREVTDFFSGAIKSSIKQRTEKGEKRDDFIQLMLEAREGTLKTEESELEAFEKDAIIKDSATPKVSTSDLLDDDGIAANCVLFILAGFDTTQSLLLFSAYALAMNPDVQERLRMEVESVLAETSGEFTYEGLSKMTYLDMVINETLRFWPPAVGTDRQCLKDYPITGTNFVLKKGDAVAVPIFALQHDEDFYPNPEKFDPERFSPENKSSINPYAFLPFGQGPRNCIGMRFALTEAKVVISYLVNNFKIEPSAKTPIPMKFAKSTSLKPEGGLHLRLIKVQHS